MFTASTSGFKSLPSVYVDATLETVSSVASPLPYAVLEPEWPVGGRHVLAFHDAEGLIVYQAFNRDIASYAVAHQTFEGCPTYNPSRMTWIKTSFMWMMYRCGWGIKDSNQERILALKITHQGMLSILAMACTTGSLGDDGTVRLQWDPDHSPCGIPLSRQAIQLGLKGAVAQRFLREYLVRIEDVTDTLVRPQWRVVLPEAIAFMSLHTAGANNASRTVDQQTAWNIYGCVGMGASPNEASLPLMCPHEQIYPIPDQLLSSLGVVRH